MVGSFGGNPMTERELGHGVEPLEQLQAERDVLVEQIKDLWALYGPGGLGESQRSAELARLSALLRAQAAMHDQKVTEAALEQGARAHPDYLALLARQTSDRAQYFKLNAHIDAIDAKMMRGQAMLRLASREMSL